MTAAITPESNCYFNSPQGLIFISTTDMGIRKLNFVDNNTFATEIKIPSHPLLIQLFSELEKYFGGTLTKFTVPLDLQGTFFQRKVWDAVSSVPYGEVISYARLSAILHQPDAIRAVAHANSQNPLLLLVPCHRIIGSNGDLTGYAGGLSRKKLLLEMEGALQQLSLDLH